MRSPRSARASGRAAVLAAALAVCPRPAPATTVLPVTVEELTRRADAVVVATPRVERSQWLGGYIVTDVELEVSAAVRGGVRAGERVTLRVPGGVVGAVGQRVPGVPALETGTPYVVFLRRAPDVAGVYYLAHLTAAVLPLRAEAGGVVRVVPASEGLVVQPDARATGSRSVAPPTLMAPTGMDLASFARAIAAVP